MALAVLIFSEGFVFVDQINKGIQI
jgi:hypothetical protein